MTNKRIVKDLKAIADFFISESQGVVPVALEEAIKIIEQYPCEDCVSREALINELKLGYFNKDLQEVKSAPCVIDAMIDWAIRTVKRQPSVKPQRALGRWIEQTDKNKKLYGWFYCSECGAVLGQVDGANYCSECGAEMEG